MLKASDPKTRFLCDEIYNVPQYFISDPMFEISPPHAHPLSFIYPSIIQDCIPLFGLLSLSPTRSTQNTFLSSVLFLSASYSSHLSSSFLPLSVFWTFLLVFSVSLHPASPPSFPPLPPVMNESVCWVQFIFTEQGNAHCQSLLPSTSLFLH